MARKRILIAAYNLGFGGIETSLVNLLKNINYNLYDVRLVLEKKEGAFLTDIPKSVNVTEYKVSNNKNIFIRKFTNLCKQLKWKFFNHNRYYASISYATYSKPCSFVARTSSKNPILFVHSNYYQSYNQDEVITKHFFDGININDFNSIIFVSNESKKDLCNIYDIDGKSHVINNLIDYKKIVKLSKEKIDVSSYDGKTFLFVGRLEEASKKITRILEVAKLCKKNNIKSRFWIVGDGPDKDTYLSFQKEYALDNVTFFGPMKNPYPYIKASDYLILTSSYEGFPVVYNEAIVLGKYILTTIDVSDDYISIPDRFGLVAKQDISDIYDKVVYLSQSDVKFYENVDFKRLNEQRIKKIENLMEYDNDKV